MQASVVPLNNSLSLSPEMNPGELVAKYRCLEVESIEINEI